MPALVTQWHGSLSDGVCHKMTNPISVGNAYATANAVTPRKIWITSASNAPTGLLLTQSACIIDHHTPRRKQVGAAVVV